MTTHAEFSTALHNLSDGLASLLNQLDAHATTPLDVENFCDNIQSMKSMVDTLKQSPEEAPGDEGPEEDTGAPARLPRPKAAAKRRAAPPAPTPPRRKSS